MNKSDADFPPQHKFYYDNIMKGREAGGEVLKWKMPGEPLFKDLWGIGYKEEKNNPRRGLRQLFAAPSFY